MGSDARVRGPGRDDTLPVLPRDRKLLPVTYRHCMEKISIFMGSEDVTRSSLYIPLSRLRLACIGC